MGSAKCYKFVTKKGRVIPFAGINTIFPNMEGFRIFWRLEQTAGAGQRLGKFIL